MSHRRTEPDTEPAPDHGPDALADQDVDEVRGQTDGVEGPDGDVVDPGELGATPTSPLGSDDDPGSFVNS